MGPSPCWLAAHGGDHASALRFHAGTQQQHACVDRIRAEPERQPILSRVYSRYPRHHRGVAIRAARFHGLPRGGVEHCAAYGALRACIRESWDNTGPMGLAWLNECVRYATLKIETAEVPQASLGFIQSFGFEVGKSLPFATPLQEWVWEDDTEEAITKTFRRLTERIEASSAGNVAGSAR